MDFPATPTQTTSSVKPLLAYWIVGAIVGFLYLRPDIASGFGTWSSGHLISSLLALAATVVTAVAYSKVTMTEGRSLHLPTLFGFSIVNGICETILFMASFKLGVAIADPFTAQLLWLFLAGTLSFFIYSGVIHVFFWLNVLPPHLNKGPAVQTPRRIWILGLVSMSMLWVWPYFAYQDFWSVVVLHTLFDMGMVYCIRYRLAL